MTTESTPGALRLNDQLGMLPEPDLRADPCSADGAQTDYYTAGTVRRLLAAEREQMRAQAARDAVETRWAMREQIAAWLDGQGQPGYATEVRCRDWA